MFQSTERSGPAKRTPVRTALTLLRRSNKRPYSPKCRERLSGKSLRGLWRAGFGTTTVQERAFCAPFRRFVWPLVGWFESFQTVSRRSILGSSYKGSCIAEPPTCQNCRRAGIEYPPAPHLATSMDRYAGCRMDSRGPTFVCCTHVTPRWPDRPRTPLRLLLSTTYPQHQGSYPRFTPYLVRLGKSPMPRAQYALACQP